MSTSLVAPARNSRQRFVHESPDSLTRWTLVSPPGLPSDAPAANTVTIDGRTFRSDNLTGSALPVAFTVALVHTKAERSRRKDVA